LRSGAAVPKLMTTLPSISPNTRRSLLIVEISILVVSIGFNLNDPAVRQSFLTVINIALVTIAIAPFIVILPVNSPLWQRRVYLLLAIFILSLANHFKVPTYSLHLVFLLKGCLLLNRREVIAIAAISLILNITSFSIRAPR
jgi:hypothetical protein